MKIKKYTTEQISLNKKNEQGLFTEKRPIALLDIMQLDDDITLSFGYRSARHKKPIEYCITHKGITVKLSDNMHSTVEDIAKNLTSEMIINRYKELKLI